MSSIRSLLNLGATGPGRIIILDANGNTKLVDLDYILLPGELVLTSGDSPVWLNDTDVLPGGLIDEDSELDALKVDDEIGQIFAALEAGDDPTLAEEFAPAAGDGPQGSSIGGVGEIERTGAQVLASTFFETDGVQTQGLSETQSVALLNALRSAVNTNLLPSALASSERVLEDNVISGNIIASDLDLPSGSSLTFTTTSTAAGLTFNSDGTYSFDASSYDSLSEGEELDIVVPVTVTDEVGGTDTTTLTITVTGTNDDPVAVSKTDAVTEDASISGQLTATDVDLPSGSSLSFTTTSTATGLTLNSDGTYTFDASSYDSLSKDETLDIVVPVTVTDEVGGTDTTTLTITVTGTNDDPVANIATADVLEDSNLTGVVTASDVDLSSSSNLTFSTTSTATGLTFNSDGTYSFDASSYDSLSKDETLDIVVPVTVTDEVGGTDSTTLTITVTGTNDDPIAVSKTDAVTEDASISGQLTATDVDLPSGSSLSFATTSTATGLTLNSDGSYSFDASSYDSLSKDETLDIVVPVTVTDEVGGTDTTTLTITVTGTNDDPVANIATADVLEDSNLTGVVTASDVDLPSSSNLTFSTTSTATGLTFNSDGTYSFDASSYDSLSKDEILDIVVPVTVTDEVGETDTTTLTITVTGTNDDPVAVSKTDAVTEDASISGQLTATDVDLPSGSSLSFTTTSTATGLTLNSDGSYTFDASSYDSLSKDETLDIVVPVTVIDEVGGTDTTTLMITITGTNDDPVANIATADVLEDSNLTGVVTASDVDLPSSSNLTFSTTSTATGLTFNSDGNYSFDASSYDSLSEGEELDIVVPVTVTDEVGGTDTTTLTITVTGTNDDPVAVPKTDAVTEDASISGQLTATDVDLPSGSSLSFTTTSTATGLTLNSDGTYTFDASSYDSLSKDETLDIVVPVTVTDEVGGTDTTTLTITITGTNDDPVANIATADVLEDSNLTGVVTASDVDLPSDSSLTFTTTSTATGLTFNSDGTYSFDASSYDSLSKDETLDIVVPVTVTDEVGGTDTTTLTITVTGTNDDPVAVSKTDAVTEGASISGQLTATDVDLPSGSSLSFTTTSTATGLTLNSDGSYTFDASSYDSLSKDETLDIVVPVTVTDEVGGTDTTTLTITVTGANDDPVAVSKTDAVTEDASISGQLTATDVDLPSGSSLSFTTTSTATGLTLNSDGSYSFDASSYDSLSKDETLDIVVPVTVTDEVGGTDTTTLTITVTGTNDDPVAVSKTDAVTEDASISGQLTATDVDLPSGSALSFTTTNTAAGLTLNSDGSYTFDASSYDSLSKDETLDIVVPVTVTDEVGGTDTTTLTITVTGTNDDPVAVSKIDAVTEDTSISGQLAATDVDLPSGSSLSFTTTSTATGLTLNSDGSYTFDASSYDSLSKGETLDIVVPVTVTDEVGGTDTTTLTITITGTNDDPVANIAATDVLEDSNLTGVVTASDVDLPSSSNLTFSTTSTATGLTFNSDGSYSFDASSYDSLSKDETLDIVVPVTVTDEVGGTDTTILTITITGTNDDPVANIATADVLEDSNLTGVVTASDVDLPSSSNLTFSTTSTATGLTFNSDGSYSFDASSYDSLSKDETLDIVVPVTVTDEVGGTDTTTLTITITGTNDDPVANIAAADVLEDSNLTGVVTASDVDLPSSSNLTFSTTSTATGLTFNSDGTYSFDASSYDSLSKGETLDIVVPVTVTDEVGGTDTTILTITITGTNDDPVANIATVDVLEDSNLTGVVTASDVDLPSSSNLTFSTTSTATGLTFNSDGTYSFDASSYDSLSKDETLDIVVPVTVTDEAGGTDTTTLTITITGTNDDPVANIATAGVLEDAILNSAVTASDVDLPPGSNLTFTTTSTATGLTFNSDGSYTFDASSYDSLSKNEKLDIIVSVTVTDESGGTDTTLLTITITGTNDDPVAVAKVDAVVEDNMIAGHVSASDVDLPVGNSLSFTTTSTAAGLTLNTDGSYIFDANSYDFLSENEILEVVVPVTVTDEAGGTDTTTLTITVTGTNDSATVSSVSKVLAETDVALTSTGTLTSVDVDNPDNTFTPATVSGPIGTLTLLSNGNWSFLANSAFDSMQVGDEVRHTFNITSIDGTPSSVEIIIQGTNDAPVINSAVGVTGSLEEDTPSYQTTGTLVASDPDHDVSSDMTWTNVTTGTPTYGSFSLDANGKWTYVLNNNNTVVQSLSEGQLVTDTFTIQVSDGDLTDTQVVTITIKGDNDTPVITSGVTSGATVEDVTTVATGQLVFHDIDLLDTLSWAVNGGGTGTYGDLSIDQNGLWTYTLVSTRVDSLHQGEVVNESFTVRLSDNHGGFVEQVINLTVTGMNDLPTVTGDVVGVVEEDTTLSVDGTIVASDADVPDSVTMTLTSATDTPYGLFSFNPSTGKWVYTLDNAEAQKLAENETVTEIFNIKVADTYGGITNQSVTITIKGDNDQPTISGDSSGNVKEDTTYTATGTLAVADVDVIDDHSWSVSGGGVGNFGSLSIDANGEWTYNLNNGSNRVQRIGEGDTKKDFFTIIVDDGKGGTDTQLISITITGTNDAPRLGGSRRGDVTEDGTLSITKQLYHGDKDVGDTHTWTVVSSPASSLGTFVLSATGKWTFTLNNGAAQHLDAGDKVVESYQVKVEDQEGASKTKTVQVSIFGTNDIPTLEGDLTGDATEDIGLIVTGVLTDGDVDADDTHVYEALNPSGRYGELVLTPAGNWTYTLDNTKAQVQALADSETLTETFRVTVEDSHGAKTEKNIVVTINGNNDDPTITGPNSGTVIEAVSGQQETSGKLVALDVDTTDSHSWKVQTGTGLSGSLLGSYGTLSIDETTGMWTYTLDSTKTETVALDAGEVVNDPFTIEVSDGNGGTDTQVITINVVGTNTSPLIVGDETGTITELVGTGVSGVDNKVIGQLDSGDPDGSDSHDWLIVEPTGTYGTMSIDANGKWTFVLNDAASSVNGLDNGDIVTDTFTVQVSDSFGQVSTAQVEVTITGTNDAPTLVGSNVTGTITEDGATSVSGKLKSGDPDVHDTSSWSIDDATGVYGSLTINSAGVWTYSVTDMNAPAIQALSPTTSITETFTVTVTDSAGLTASKNVVVTIQGTNDKPTLGGDTTATFEEDVTASPLSGTITSVDIDTDVASGTDTDAVDTVKFISATITGNLGTLTISDAGVWSYVVDNNSENVQGLREGETHTEVFNVHAFDEFGGVVNQPLTITIQGTNDLPIVLGEDTGRVAKDSTWETTQGMVYATDVDVLDTVSEWSVSPVDGSYGQLTIDSNGIWTFVLDDSKPATSGLVAGDSVTDTFYVTAKDTAGGVSATYPVVITVLGADDGTGPGGGGTPNDQPSVTGQISGAVTEDALTAESGQLLVDDNDSGDSHTWSLSADTDGDNIVQGLYGHLELNPITGRWDYILDNNNATVQALDHGETLQDTFSVEVKDSSGEANDTGTQTITIDIKGTADDVEISDPVVETVNVTEDTDISKSGTLVAPAELGDPAWHLASGAGDYGTLTLNEAGDWTYNLNSSIPAVDRLNVGESLTEIFEVVVVDEFGKTTVDSNGDPVKMQITVVVNGSNDGPNITGELAATISNTDDDSQIVGNLNDGDVDATDTHTWSLPDETTTNEQDGTYGKLILDPVTGQYRYELDKSIDAVKNLGETETLTDIFNVKVVDALGLESVKPVTITIAGSNLEPVITGDLTGDSVEDTAIVTTGSLVAVESNTDDTASFIAKTASGGNALQGTYGQFEITSDGDWTYSLYNTQPHVQELSPSDIVTESFIVTAVDSFGVTTRETVTIEIKGTNDRPEVSGDSTGVVSETQTLTATGNLVTSDLDESDSHSYSVTTSASYGALVVNPTTGVWIYTIDSDNATVNSLAKGSSITDTAIITVMDAFGGTDTISVDITINGENDAPEISGNLTADANEDTNTMLTGQLETGDPDVLQTADTHTWTLLSNTSPYGDMSLDQNGKWSFNLTNTHSDIQALGNGESIDITYQVKVTDQHNVSHTQDVTITVNGTNDLPTITGPTTGSVAEDGTAIQQGDLDFTDIDVNDSHTWGVQGGGAGTYGSLTVDANGQWTYTLANSSPAVQGLAQGQTEQDTFTVTLFDGTDTVTKEVTIDVSGSNDLPSISGDTSTSTTQDAAAHVGGSLSAVDTDTNDTHTWTLVGSAEGQYGHFVLNQLTGNWEYQIDNTLSGSDALGQGETDSELFVVQVSDSSGATKNQTVSIEVTGRNDAPQITSVIATGNAIVGYTTQALGSFTASDADSNNTDLVWSIVDQEGTYGTLSIDQTGAWTYNIDESKPGATSLKAGSSGQEIFTIQVTDTHGAVTQETVTIDVDGAFYNGVVTTGADILTGTANNEVMFGDPLGSSASSQDTFVWLSGSLGLVNGLPGRDIIREFDASNDSIDIGGIVSADSLANLNALTSSISLVEAGSNVLLSINDGAGVIQTIEFESMNLNTLLEHPNASALSSADQIIRMLGNGTLKVSEHIGDDSANSITGTAGSDSLYGLEGDDFLTGGEGDDILTGGSGNDIFIWHQDETNSVAGHDEVSDFELAGGDKLDFRDILPDVIDGTDLTNLLTHVNASIASDNETIELVVTPETGLTQTIDVHVGDVGAFGLSGVSSSADIVSELLSRDAFKWD